MANLTEDEVRDLAGKVLDFKNSKIAKSGVGQITTFSGLLKFGKREGLQNVCKE